LEAEYADTQTQPVASRQSLSDKRTIVSAWVPYLVSRAHQALRAGGRSVLVNSAFLVANTLAGSFFGFVFWLVAARSYTQAQVGVGAAYISALTFLVSLGDVGMGTLLIRFAPTLAGQERARFISSAMSCAALATLSAAVLFALGTPLWAPDLSDLARSPLYLVVFAASTLAFCQSQQLDRVFVAFQVTHYTFARNLLGNMVRVALAFTVGRMFGAMGLLLSVGGASVVTYALASRVFARRAVPDYSARPQLDWSLIGGKVSYSLSNYAASLLWSSPALVYPLVTVAILGPKANAHFYISWMVANLLFIVPSAVSTSAFAHASNSLAVLGQGPIQAGNPDGKAAHSSFWKAMRFSLAGLVPLALILIAGAHMVLSLFGDDYGSEGRTLFMLLLLSVFPYTVNTFVTVHHRIEQRVKALVWTSGAITALCLSLSIALGLAYGLAGIGVGWLAGHIAGVPLAMLSRRVSSRSTSEVWVEQALEQPS
jgi:O-antigen/teichoic acid export membrane protein